MQQYRYWIFDLDGTLTVPQHNFDAIREALGIPPGHYILEYLDSLPAAAAAPLHTQLEAIENELVRQVEPAQGALEAVSRLGEQQLALGILTRNTSNNALKTLEHLGLSRYFRKAAVLGRDNSSAKPAPDGIVNLLKAWHGDAAACVMVGDHRLDLETGRNAGVATTHVSAGEQWPALTDHHFSSMQQLAAALS